MTRLFIVGATGLVGRCVVERALNDSRVSNVVALTRRPLPAHPRLNNPIMSFEKLDPKARWWDVDAVVCALGTTLKKAGSKEAFRRVDFEYPVRIAEIAKARGAKAYVLNSSVGADPDARGFYLRVKGETELALERLRYPSLTIVRPSILAGDRDEFRLGERVALAAMTAVKPLIPRRYRPVSADDVAASLLEAAIEARPGVRFIESDQI